MAKFCSRCGAKLDETTGMCPRCDDNKTTKVPGPMQPVEMTAMKSRDVSNKKGAKRVSRSERKARKKAAKKAKSAQWSTGKKVRRFCLKFLVTVLLFAALGGGIVGTLEYFEIADIPIAATIIDKLKNHRQNTGSILLDNGDYVFTPSEEYVAYDENYNVLYFNNQLIVYTFSEMSENDANELADFVNGEVVGRISGCMNVLQIRVKTSTLAELEVLAARLMERSEVVYAGYDYPIQPFSTDTDLNPWSEDANHPEANLGDESSPSGNDWWAEAIGAYTAWSYSSACQPIKVGILDSGFDADHEDLNGRITFLPEYALNTEEDHGTHVAGIIGAQNNDVGLRGIADSADLICVDWSPENSLSYLSTGEYIEIIKQLIEADAKIINNSWGNSVFWSEAGFMLTLYWDEEGHFHGIDNEFITLNDNNGNRTEFAFVGDSRDNVQFFINQTHVTYETFMKEIQNGCTIRLVTEHSKVKEVYYITDDYDYLREQLVVKFTGAYDSYIAYCKAFSRRTSLECVLMMIQLMLNDEKDFLMIQAAGNGKKPEAIGVDTYYTAFFCAVDAETYNLLSESTRSTLAQRGIDYHALDERVLIVGAVENKRDENGNYMMSQYSNFGSNVDICAPGGMGGDNPGQNIFSTLTDNHYGENAGTSMAAPMVSGSAAFIWALNPELSAPEVRNILLTNYETKAQGVGDGESYVYPMVNVGAAAAAVLSDMDNDKQYTLPADAVEFNGHYYYVYDVDTITDWNMAQEYCEEQGGYLATITSAEEDLFLYSYIVDAGYRSVMFGLTDQEQTDDWHWVTGEEFFYQNWCTGEPNHQGGYEHYGMYYERNTDGTWNDGSGRGGPFLCEWGEYSVADNSSAEEPEVPDSAFGRYLTAAAKITESGSWSEQVTLEADMSIVYDGGRTRTSVTMNSNSRISNYVEGDLSQVEISGTANMKIMGQEYVWSTEYKDGIAHYQYTEPVQESLSVEISPDFFDFGILSEEAILDEEMRGNELLFTVSGEDMTDIGLAVVRQMNGIGNLEYGDVEVGVTLDDSGKISEIAMYFTASMEYQGNEANVVYEIQYAFT